MLHEVGDAGLLAGLAAGASQDIGRHGEGAGARQTGGDHPRPVGQDGALEHRADGTGIDDALRQRVRRGTSGEIGPPLRAGAARLGAVGWAGSRRFAPLRMGPHRALMSHGDGVPLARPTSAVPRATDVDMVVEEDFPMASRRVRLAALLGTFALVASGCSPAGSAAPSGSGASGECAGSGTAATQGAELQIPETEDGKFNVAMVLIGPHDDGGWSQAHYEGLQYLCENLPGTHVAYVENVLDNAASEQAFRSLARKGFDFIIGTSFGYMDCMATVAEEFPDQTFLHLTGYKSNGKNFGNFFGAVEDMKYLAGMLAGSRAKKDNNPKIGYMATFPIPEEVRLGNAIMLGAKQTCPECTLDVRWIGTWHDPAKEKEAAASLFDAGADVVFTGADTPAVADVAQEKGKWGVTYDHPGSCHVDACLTAPYWILGSRVQAHRRAGQGRHLQGWLRVFRRRFEGHGVIRFHGWPDATEGHHRPPGRGCPEGQGHAGQDA